MKSMLFSCLLFSLLLLSGITHAEGECPPGMFPTNPPGTQGPVGCAPIPGYQQQQAPQAPPPQWATRWGAVATDGPGGHLGAVTGLSSKSEAEKAAIADCRAKGASQCAIEVAYDNECAAMVVGDKIHNVTADVTLKKAIQSSIKTCKEADTNCHVYYSACSLPVRIQ